MPADKVIGQAIVFQKIFLPIQKTGSAFHTASRLFSFMGITCAGGISPTVYRHISWEERQHAVAQADPQAVSRKHHEPHRPKNVAHRHAHGHGRAQPQVPFTPPLPKHRRQKCRQHRAYDISARVAKERAHPRLEPGKYRYTHQSQQHIHPHRKQRAYGPQQPATQHHRKNGQVDGDEWQRNLYL